MKGLVLFRTGPFFCIEEKDVHFVQFGFCEETSVRKKRGMYRGVKDAWAIFDEYALLLHTPITVLFTSTLSFNEKEEDNIWQRSYNAFIFLLLCKHFFANDYS